jgi:hypothetical protein
MDLSITDVTTLETGHLLKTGEEYSLVRLSATNIDQILALQDIAFANLTKDQGDYLLRKDRDFFTNHFAAGGDMLGIVHNGNLIAQSIIVNPTKEHPKTGMGLQPDKALRKLTILQGVIVDPTYRGNRLMETMVDAWMRVSVKNGRSEALAEVMPGNLYSWGVFLNKGMHIEAIGIDPADNTEVYNLHAHLPLHRIFKHSAKTKIPSAQTDIDAQKELLKHGYKGAKFDREGGHIVFRLPRKHEHCL